MITITLFKLKGGKGWDYNVAHDSWAKYFKTNHAVEVFYQHNVENIELAKRVEERLMALMDRLNETQTQKFKGNLAALLN